MDFVDSSLLSLPLNMSDQATFLCINRRTYGKIFECLLTCIVMIGIVYMVVTFLTLVNPSGSVHVMFATTGYMACVNLISAPIGFYGSKKFRYWALITYFILASYYIYAYMFYLYFYTGSSELNIVNNTQKITSTSKENGGLLLHKSTITCHIILISLSMFAICARIIATTKGVEPAKIVIQDNLSSD